LKRETANYKPNAPKHSPTAKVVMLVTQMQRAKVATVVAMAVMAVLEVLAVTMPHVMPVCQVQWEQVQVQAHKHNKQDKVVLVQPLVPTTWAQLRLLQLVVPQLVQYVAQDNKVLRMR
ncbi:hypothetical protein K4H00_20930, partial [Mycobacterium tuberculosis]|nr:hypothetical protein [Mycobacterium tuberculosis]